MTVVVADRGYLTATVANIAAAAKVSRWTFYQHFPDKEACFLAAAETGRDLMIDHLEQVMRQVLSEPVEPLEALRRGDPGVSHPVAWGTVVCPARSIWRPPWPGLVHIWR
ncbi:TetR/AcrR family transcriptional regulator [Nocardia sp. SC052]|uniref:TetR/AcrR family transcriptional regulator n=1 Tax=Nocardia sichangensis TaxID=3385975 RepID=UPI0039A33C36